ncbi:hypothetical protein [Rhodoplanes sp. SY1]|uniref:hypothetical protein n=1 Tax=Rhodoplanes sp. SY1 TaxID=3166646 RepID=UPI0038B57641
MSHPDQPGYSSVGGTRPPTREAVAETATRIRRWGLRRHRTGTAGPGRLSVIRLLALRLPVLRLPVLCVVVICLSVL